MLAPQIALRFISSKKVQSILIIIGFGIGIGTNIFVGNLIMAIEDDLINRTIQSQPHITIEPRTAQPYVPEWLEINETLHNMSEITATTYIYEGRGFIYDIHPDYTIDILVRGMGSLEEASKIYDFYNEDFIGTKPVEIRDVIIGESLAEELDVGVGDELNISNSPQRVEFLMKTVKITGIYDLGNSQMNSMWMVGSHTMSTFLLYALDRVTSFIIQIEDYNIADVVADKITKKINNTDIVVKNWKNENEALLNSLQAQSTSVKVVQFFVLLSVTTAIASVLGITVASKRRQIGILKAMGLNDLRSAFVFFWQGTLYGLGGSVVGLGLGHLMIAAFNRFTGKDIVSVFVDQEFVRISLTIAMVAAMVASLLPSISSRKLDVIEIIREI